MDVPCIVLINKVKCLDFNYLPLGEKHNIALHGNYYNLKKKEKETVGTLVFLLIKLNFNNPIVLLC